MTPYEDGIFHVCIDLAKDRDEPAFARFITKVFHPNIYFDGKVCEDVLALHDENILSDARILQRWYVVVFRFHPSHAGMKR